MSASIDPVAVSPFNETAVKNLREAIQRQMNQVEKEKDSIFEKSKSDRSPEDQRKSRNYMRSLAIVFTHLEEARMYLGKALEFHGAEDLNAKQEKERVDALQRT